MQQGNKIIFNQDYIDVITRHYEIARAKYDKETIPDLKERYIPELKYWEGKLEYALDFTDTIEEIINIEVPLITAVKTVTGIVIPLRNIEVV